MFFFRLSILLSFVFGASFAESEYRQIIKENIAMARENDYVVVAFEQNYTVLHVVKMDSHDLILEEITVPAKKLNNNFCGFRDWLLNLAPGHTSWIVYSFEKDSGKIKNAFSYLRGCYLNMDSSDLFLTTLFNLTFKKIPLSERRKIGVRSAIAPFMNPNDVWHPPIVVDGRRVHGVFFNGWKTKWPTDGSYLSGKTIEAYLPAEESAFASYFPYWLQISGVIGKAKIRIVDSGSNLKIAKELPISIENATEPVETMTNISAEFN